MASYRFCRTDDIALLTNALNCCWAPYFPDESPMTEATFKQSIRERQVWCSSCMVAFNGADPIGVLIGAKRPSGTLVHKIAVHPDHRRQDHARHLLESLGSKLAILGPPRTVAEVPASLDAARALFSASGYVEETVLTDYVLPRDAPEARHLADASGADDSRFVIPVTVDDLLANDLLAAAGPASCWERSVDTLTARKDDIAGLAVASDERIEAYLLYLTGGAGADVTRADPEAAADVAIVSLRSLVDDGGDRLAQLLARLRQQRAGAFRLAKVHPEEMSTACLETLGFRPEGGHLLFASMARAH